MTPPAIALLEFDDIALGTRVADAMIKRAPVDVVRAGTLQPGRYLILVGGTVGDVRESHNEGLLVGGDALKDEIFLPDVHPEVYESLDGTRRANDGDALGIIETSLMPANVRAADRAVKAAKVTIVEIRLGDGLGGKGLTHVTGQLADVEAAMAAGVASVGAPNVVTRSVIIPAQHSELRDHVALSTTFNRQRASRRSRR